MNLCINLFFVLFHWHRERESMTFFSNEYDWSFMECHVQHVSTEIFRWLKPWNYEKQLLMWRLYMLFMSLILISNHSVFMEVLPNNMTSYNLHYKSACALTWNIYIERISWFFPSNYEFVFTSQEFSVYTAPHL